MEGSEKLRFPGFGLVTGSVSTSTGNGKAQTPYRERKLYVFGELWKDAIEGSFIVGGDCVKDCFELEPVRRGVVSKDL